MAQLLLQSDQLPQEVMFLLAEEDAHITRFRAKVEKEKHRIDADFDLVRSELVNMVDDLKV
jgi:F-box/WD-40 domain protein 7